jgi:putative Mg2+ transporter-C (MgtC) family protein
MQHVPVTEIEFVARLFLALGLGALIGLERQLRNHEGGLKTNALVATGSAMFVMMASRFGEPDRIIGQILPGIGFLGAGMIMRDGLHVRGLNTAATMWCSAAVGALVGTGENLLAALAAVTVVAANVVLREVAVWIDRKHEAGGRKVSGNAGQ